MSEQETAQRTTETRYGLRLAPIKARALIASEGPWRAENAQEGVKGGCAWGVVSESKVIVEHDFVSPVNADFIANARTDIPALLREIERLGPSATRRIYELAEIGALHNHRFAGGHRDMRFDTCTHRDCALVRSKVEGAETPIASQDAPPVTGKTPIEVRRDAPTKRYPEGDIDEVCGRGVMHLERMDENTVSLMLYGEAGDVICLMIEPKVWPKRGSAPHVQTRLFWYDTKEEIAKSRTKMRKSHRRNSRVDVR